MEQFANHIALTGCIASAPEYSHSNHGRRFYSFFLEVARLSGAIDRLPILVSEELLAATPADEGEGISIEGQIRSFNNRSNVGRRLIISVLAEKLAVTSAPHLAAMMPSTPVPQPISSTGQPCKRAPSANRLTSSDTIIRVVS